MCVYTYIYRCACACVYTYICRCVLFEPTNVVVSGDTARVDTSPQVSRHRYFFVEKNSDGNIFFVHTSQQVPDIGSFTEASGRLLSTFFIFHILFFKWCWFFLWSQQVSRHSNMDTHRYPSISQYPFDAMFF